MNNTKILVVTAWAFNPKDLWTILKAIRQQGWHFKLLSSKPYIEEEYGAKKQKAEVPRYGVDTIADFPMETLPEYDGLVLSSGQKITRERLYYDGKLQSIVERMASKPIAAPCGMVPVLRLLLKGRKATCFPSVRYLLEQSGVEYVNTSIVVDGKIVTVPVEENVVLMMEKFIELVKGDHRANSRTP